MLYVRVLLVASVITVGGCVAPPKPANPPAQDSKALAKEIDRVCSLPEAERAAELEKIKNEFGMVLYCGGK